MTELVFTPPGKDSSGFLRRARRAIELSKVDPANMSVHYVDELVEFLADYVTEPADRAQAIEALLDATQEQFNNMLAAIAGSNDNAIPPASPEA